MSAQPAAHIRQRLGEIIDELQALSGDEFSKKHTLNVEADSLRQQLAGLSDESSDAILKSWADRAGRKGAHTTDDETELAKARIVSPMEGGGSA